MICLNDVGLYAPVMAYIQRRHRKKRINKKWHQLFWKGYEAQPCRKNHKVYINGYYYFFSLVNNL